MSDKTYNYTIRDILFQALHAWSQGQGRAEFCCLQEIRRAL